MVSLNVDNVIIADSSPVIDRIINLFNQNEKRNLRIGKGVKITGSKLKILGKDGNISKDETTWIQVAVST